jgi:hypothetical protein
MLPRSEEEEAEGSKSRLAEGLEGKAVAFQRH